MSPRLFLGNFDFEHRLVDPGREPSVKLKRFYAQLVTSWLSIAEDGDWIWTPMPIDPHFFDVAADAGLPRIVPTTSLSEVPRDFECVPWGWSQEVCELVDRFGWRADIPTDAAVRSANSRTTSESLERTWQVGISGARRIDSLSDLSHAVDSLSNANCGWVVKAEYSMSARERILGQGRLTAADNNWVIRRLAGQSDVFFEPWVERIDEIGIQMEIPKSGEVALVGVTPMLVDRRGQYAGSWFAYNDERFTSSRSLWPQAIKVALRAACYLQSTGYFGPLGIDAMIYRDERGLPQVRPLQDLNARWTMGRLSLGWRRLLNPGEQACWQLLPTGHEMNLPDFRLRRLMTISPSSVGGIACEHLSRVVIAID